jgi:hypothetical protein
MNIQKLRPKKSFITLGPGDHRRNPLQDLQPLLDGGSGPGLQKHDPGPRVRPSRRRPAGEARAVDEKRHFARRTYRRQTRRCRQFKRF